jgi:hypothetical protein
VDALGVEDMLSTIYLEGTSYLDNGHVSKPVNGTEKSSRRKGTKAKEEWREKDSPPEESFVLY